jgi:hypothetical protein
MRSASYSDASGIGAGPRALDGGGGECGLNDFVAFAKWKKYLGMRFNLGEVNLFPQMKGFRDRLTEEASRNWMAVRGRGLPHAGKGLHGEIGEPTLSRQIYCGLID